MPVPVPSGNAPKDSASSWGPSGNTFEQGNYDRESRYPPRDPVPIPDQPPFTARLLNLDWEISEAKIKELFETPDYKVVSIRVPRDVANGRIRGFAFVEFEDRESLEKALSLEGTQLLSRTLRVVVAEPPQNRQDDRFEGDWRSTRTGPLPPLEGERGSRRGPRREFNDGHDYDSWERKGPLPPFEDRGDRGPRRGPRRDFNEGPQDTENWERRGPLPPLEGEEGSHPRRQRGGPGGRFGGPPDDHDYDNWERKGPLPPRRERKSSFPSSDASEASENWRSAGRQGSTGGRGQRIVSTDSTGSAPGAGSTGPRKKLDLKPRTVGAHEAVPGAAPEEVRASLFGAAKPVDTQRKFIEVEEKQRKIEEERREHHKEHRHQKEDSKNDDKINQVRKRFEVLDTEDHEEGASEEGHTGVSDVSDSKPLEKPTVAENLLNKEASAEELESGDWNVVKRSARK
jgi:translation initiation factor 4B